MIPLDRVDAILIDMNGTFMFGQDRFGPQEDYFATYRAVGGQVLAPVDVQRVVNATVAALGTRYRDRAHFDPFPSVADVLAELPETRGLPPRERNLIEAVIAGHERGHVPGAYAAALHQLSALRPLVLVSNIWSAAPPWRTALANDGLLDLFAAVVFSSEHGCIKPAPRIYAIARDRACVPFDRILFIGDDPIADVAAPRSLGMMTAQVGLVPPPEADMTAPGLPELVARWP